MGNFGSPILFCLGGLRMFTLEQCKSNITSVDRQLLWFLLEEQKETNRLLGLLTNVNKQVEQTLPDDNKMTVKRRGRAKGVNVK